MRIPQIRHLRPPMFSMSRPTPTFLRLLRPRRHVHTARPLFAPAPIPVPTFTPSAAPPTHVSTTPPITPQCPPPRLCGCEANPVGLDIDRTTPLNGTMARYYRHCLVSTGRSDWASKIELDVAEGDADAEVGGLAGHIKALAQARGSGLRDPFAPTLITNSSFAPAGHDGEGSAYILPAGIYLPRIPSSDAAVRSLLRHYLLPAPTETPTSTSTSTAGTTEVYRFADAQRVKEAIVLICSHHSRDTRCGLTAPVLRRQFEKVLQAKNIPILTDADREGRAGAVRIGYTSHLSGHKFAGNVVVYLPAGGAGESGWGVWYGRVSAEHVEGIVDETLLGGRVIRELVRGVVGAEGKVDVE